MGNLRDLIFLRIIALKRKKCLIHLHGAYYRELIDSAMPAWQRKLNVKAIGKTDGAIVLGESLRYIFRDILPEDKIFVIPNCADCDVLMSNDEFAASLTRKHDVKQVLYLSNFIKSKGYPIVLELALLEKKRHERGGERKLSFHFAGCFFDKAERKFFFDFADRHALWDYISFHGTVSGDEKLALLKECDVFALPTLYPREGQPISILEAMGNGMMILTTDHAGIPDIVTNGENGIVLDKNNLRAEEIYEMLLEKCADEEYLKKVAKTNRQLVEERYNEDCFIGNIGKRFESLIGTD
jgi:glycosyltransferase involved in cell wall biosynthesis